MRTFSSSGDQGMLWPARGQLLPALMDRGDHPQRATVVPVNLRTRGKTRCSASAAASTRWCRPAKWARSWARTAPRPAGPRAGDRAGGDQDTPLPPRQAVNPGHRVADEVRVALTHRPADQPQSLGVPGPVASSRQSGRQDAAGRECDHRCGEDEAAADHGGLGHGGDVAVQRRGARVQGPGQPVDGMRGDRHADQRDACKERDRQRLPQRDPKSRSPTRPPRRRQTRPSVACRTLASLAAVWAVMADWPPLAARGGFGCPAARPAKPRPSS